MIDISNKPYFHYNEDIKSLMEPIRKQSDAKFLGFTRIFPDQKRFLICDNKDCWVDYYKNDLYRYSTYEDRYKILSSAFYMWDHLFYAPPEIYDWFIKKYNIAHGLSVIQQHGDYCDAFVFATHASNNQINNFYLNHKNFFEDFMNKFYIKMAYPLSDLSSQTFQIPEDTQYISNPFLCLTARQQDCAQFLIEGLNTKEIARSLDLSPRTIETHIDILKDKFSSKTRAQLVYSLRKFL